MDGALKVNTAVVEVYLANNISGDAGCAALAEAPKVNTVVTKARLLATAIRFRVCSIG